MRLISAVPAVQIRLVLMKWKNLIKIISVLSFFLVAYILAVVYCPVDLTELFTKLLKDWWNGK